jgi:hypothetical protein
MMKSGKGKVMSKVNKIVTKNGVKFDLNGLPISLRGTTAYKDVYFGDAWGPGNEIYVAIAALNENEAKIAGRETYMFHLSKHGNPLDAAYVAMKFNEDRAKNVRKLKGVTTGAWQCVIPKFEYEAIDTKDNIARRRSIIAKRTARLTDRSKVKTNVIRSTPKSVHKQTPTITLDNALAAACLALKGYTGPKDVKMIRHIIEGHLAFYRNAADVESHVSDLLISGAAETTTNKPVSNIKPKTKRHEYEIQSGGRGHKYLNLHRH